MYVFSYPKGKEYNSLIKEYETYLPEFFGKLDEAYKDYPFAKDNEEYMLYVKYNQWPIRKLEYSFVIREMQKAIYDGAKVLDAGCGVSSMPFLWANFGGEVTAVDFDKKNIRLMQQFNEDNYFEINKRITLNECDIMKLPYDDHSFDIVCSTSVIEHLPYPNYLLAISEFYRVLKPNGILICTCDINAGNSSKRNALGAFSTEDIKYILSNFNDELLGDSQKYEDLSITESDIENFWNSHYYDGIGYEGNRKYVAVGFSLMRKLNVDKKEKLLSYNSVINELILYQNYVQNLLDEIERKNRFIIEIEDDSSQRLRDIEKLTSIVNELEDACNERLNNIYTLTDMVHEKDKARKHLENELQKTNIACEEYREKIKAIRNIQETLSNQKQIHEREKQILVKENKDLEQDKSKLENEKKLLLDKIEALEEDHQRLVQLNLNLEEENKHLIIEKEASVEQYKYISNKYYSLIENKAIRFLRKIKIIK